MATHWEISSPNGSLDGAQLHPASDDALTQFSQLAISLVAFVWVAIKLVWLLCLLLWYVAVGGLLVIRWAAKLAVTTLRRRLSRIAVT